MTEQDQMAMKAGEMVGRMILRLHEETGIPIHCILIGAHSQIVGMMSASVGGPMAAMCCEQAADRVRDWPSLDAVSLAYAQPSGTA